PLLGEIEVLVRMGSVDGGHRVDIPGVEMEGGAIHVYSYSHIIKYGDRVIRPIAVVVVDDDPRVEAGPLERGAEVVLDELGLLPGRDKGARVVPRVQGLVLNSDSMDADALRPHAPDVLHEVPRVGPVEFGPQAPADGVVVGLHPGRRRPWRAHDLEVRGDL